MPVVLIDIAPDDAAPELPEALAASCSESIAEGRCVLESESEGSPGEVLARVVWQGSEQLHVRISVGLDPEENARWRTRSIDFDAADDRTERWRAVGLTVATLAGEIFETESAPAPSLPPATSLPEPEEPEQRTSPAEPAPRRRLEMDPPRLWISLGGLTGPGLVGGPWRAGVLGEAGIRLWKTPIALFVDASYAGLLFADPATPRVRWVTVGFGVTAILPLWSALSLQPRIALGRDIMWFSVQQGPRSDSMRGFRNYAGFEALFVWEAGRVRPFIGAGISRANAKTDIYVGDQLKATVSELGATVELGGRVDVL